MLRGQKYEPYGFVTRHPNIKYCTSISDLISKIIDIEIGDYSSCQVKPDDMEETIPDTTTAPAARMAATAPVFSNSIKHEYETGSRESLRIENQQGSPDEKFIHKSARNAARNGEKLYDGSICPTCSSTRIVRNGTCKVCLDCGTTTGCS